jgi:hypothetical protein
MQNNTSEALLREKFHDLLESQGFRRFETPPIGYNGKPSVYPGSHVQALWECWVEATQQEQQRHAE